MSNGREDKQLPRRWLLSFDLDDTLWSTAPVLRAEQQLYRWLTQHAPKLTQRYTMEQLHEQRDAWAQAHPQWFNFMAKTRIESLREAFVACGYTGDLVVPAMAEFLYYRQQVEPYPDVIPALSALQTHCVLVSITNGNSDVSKTALKPYFAHSLNPENSGFSKPQRQMFQRALTLTGCPVKAMIHLGDDPLSDVEGARQAGIKAVWVNRQGHQWPVHLPSPFLTVSNLTEFRDWLMESNDEI